MSLKSYFGKGGIFSSSYIKTGKDFKDAVGMAGNDFFGTVSGKIMTLSALILATYGAVKLLENAFNLTFEAAQKDLEKANETFKEAKSELENVNTELKATENKIAELTGKDSLTFVEEVELEKLQQAKELLEAQQTIRQQAYTAAQKEVLDSAKETFNYASEKVLLTNEAGQTRTTGEGLAYTTLSRGEAIEEYVRKMQNAQKLINEAQEKINDGDTSNKWAKQLTDNEERVKKYQETVTQLLTSLSADAENFYDPLTGQILAGAEKEVENLKYWTDLVNNWNLSGDELAVKILQSLNDNILDVLKDSSDSTEDLDDALHSMGLTLQDLNLSKLEDLQRHLKDIIEQAEQAGDVFERVTVADVEKAFESDNQGKDWDTMAEKLKEANELYTNGLIGTDDLQMSAQWIMGDIEIDKDSDGELEFKRKWEESYNKVKKWFDTETPVKGMWSFLEDLRKKNAELFTSFDKVNGIVKFNEESFYSSAQAADALGVSVEVVDTMLHKLEEYGAYYGENFMFSGDAVADYQAALEGMKEIRDAMSTGSLKDSLNIDIEHWEKEFEALNGDLNKLTKEHIIEITFSYDMALLDQQIDEADAKWNSGVRDAQTGAERIATRYKKRQELEKHNEYDVGSDIGYAESYAQIEKLSERFNNQNLTDGQIKTLQEQIIAITDLQLAFQQLRSDGTVINWEHFLQTTEAKQQMKELVENGTLTMAELAEAMEMDVSELTLFLNAEDNISPVIDDINKQQLYDKYVSLYGEDEASGIINFWNQLEADDKFAALTAEDQATVVLEYWNSLSVEEKTAVINGDEEEINRLVSNVDLLMLSLGETPYTVTAELTDNVTPAAQKMVDYLDTEVDGKITHSYSYLHQITKKSTGIQESTGMVNSKGAAFIKGTIPSDSLVNSKYQTKRSESALVGELGPEMLVNPKTNTWETIGDRGAEFRHIPAGSIIFNHKQTKELLSKGYTLSRGKAKVVGTAWASGTAHEGKQEQKQQQAMVVLPGSATGYKYTGTGASSSSSSSRDTAKEAFEEIQDWVEVYLDRQSRLTEKLTNAIEDAVGLVNKQSATNKAIAQVQAEIAANEKAIIAYQKHADKVNLSLAYKQQVVEGKINIQTITDENLKEKIDEFTEWHEKLLECEDTIDNLNNKLKELAQQKFDNVTTEFENQIGLIEHEKELLDLSIEQIEARGHIVSTSFYNELINQETKNLEKLKEQYVTLTTTLQDLLDQKLIEKYSDEWYEMQGEINEVSQAIVESNTALVKFQKNIRDLEWESFDTLRERIGEIKEEADFLIDLMSEEKLFDNGQITAQGQATLGLQALNYNTLMSEADEYAKELEKIKKLLKDDPYNVELTERYNELLEEQRDAILEAQNAFQSAIDVIQEGFDSFLNAMDEVIEKRKEALNAEKELYDYQKQIAEQTKEIGSLEKQLAAYRGDDSEESRATVQKLETELKEARDELEEAEYDKYLSDQEQMLDQMRDETEEWMNKRMDDRDWLLQQIINYTNENAGVIQDTLESETKAVGITLSDAMNSIWSPGGTYSTVVAEYVDGFNNLFTTTNNTLNDIKLYMYELLKVADEEAAKQMELASTPVAMPEKPVQEEKPQEQPTKTESTTSKWGSWFIAKKNSVPKSQLNINQSIVDRLKYFNYDASFSALGKYYKAMGGSGNYSGTASQNIWMLNQMKSHGFENGGTIGELIQKSGEDGFVLARKGEVIFTAKQFLALKDAFVAAQPVLNSLKYVPNIYNNGHTGNVYNDVTMNFDLQNVHNANEFITELQHSPRFEKIIQQMTLGAFKGQNSLSKNRF